MDNSTRQALMMQHSALTLSLPLQRQMMSFQKWFLRVCWMSCDPLLQFTLFMHWSNVFETNTSGQQNCSERLFLRAIFTNGTYALVGKGLKPQGLPCSHSTNNTEMTSSCEHLPTPRGQRSTVKFSQ